MPLRRAFAASLRYFFDSRRFFTRRLLPFDAADFCCFFFRLPLYLLSRAIAAIFLFDAAAAFALFALFLLPPIDHFLSAFFAMPYVSLLPLFFRHYCRCRHAAFTPAMPIWRDYFHCRFDAITLFASAIFH